MSKKDKISFEEYYKQANESEPNTANNPRVIGDVGQKKRKKGTQSGRSGKSIGGTKHNKVSSA